jgi:hypothetical protein
MTNKNIRISESGLVGRFTVTVTIGLTDGQPSPMQCEWMPDVPKRGEISDADVWAYQEVRNKALARLAREAGVNIALIEL